MSVGWPYNEADGTNKYSGRDHGLQRKKRDKMLSQTIQRDMLMYLDSDSGKVQQGRPAPNLGGRSQKMADVIVDYSYRSNMNLILVVSNEFPYPKNTEWKSGENGV